MSPKTKSAASRLPGLFRPRDLEELGMPRAGLHALLANGDVERVRRGLYRRTDAPLTELETVAAVCKRLPNAVVCLLTALNIHGIGTQLPHEVWIALDRKARKPRNIDVPLRIVRFSSPLLHYAIQTKTAIGVSIHITSPARTVVDCFRYRNKVGLDVALEALRDVLRSKLATVDEIDRVAEVCRIRSVIGPYLEAVIS